MEGPPRVGSVKLEGMTQDWSASSDSFDSPTPIGGTRSNIGLSKLALDWEGGKRRLDGGRP